MQLKTVNALSGETRKVTNEWAAEAESRGTTVSASTWSYTGSGSLSGSALTGYTASVLVTPTGCGVLTNTVTLANGETLVAERTVVT